MDDTCVCCGAYFPEGRQVCPSCEHRYEPDEFFSAERKPKGVTVRGMELPDTCAACPMFEYGALSNCKLIKKPLLWYEATQKRDKDCPLEEK